MKKQIKIRGHNRNKTSRLTTKSISTPTQKNANKSKHTQLQEELRKDTSVEYSLQDYLWKIKTKEGRQIG